MYGNKKKKNESTQSVMCLLIIEMLFYDRHSQIYSDRTRIIISVTTARATRTYEFHIFRTF